MTYFDDLLETQNQPDVEYIPLVDETDDAIEPKLKDGDILGVLPLRNMVLFPGVLLPVTVGRPKSKKLVATAFKNDQLLAVCCQKAQDVQEPSEEDIFPVGTAGRVMRTLDMPDGNLMVILEGVERIHIQEIVGVRPYMKARVQILTELFPKRNDKEFVALVSSLKNVAEKIIKSMENLPAEAGMTLRSIDNPPTLVNYICGNFGVHQESELELCLFWGEAQDLKGALLQRSIVDTDTTATNLYTVDNHVVCVRTHSGWIGVHQWNILWFWRGKWMVHSHEALLLVAPLVHWEIHNPKA